MHVLTSMTYRVLSGLSAEISADFDELIACKLPKLLFPGVIGEPTGPDTIIWSLPTALLGLLRAFDGTFAPKPSPCSE